ncbi:GNAT family N-acetyltransferase [Guptibacillus algicola]|uniref:GNAT family N-acetyltransferase n=1 Tax=Guptibacillus algicola TaxID=225844 RepID=UPI001CD77ABC|nr:GNAT family N-acetyltransferase [Alkalihalobacillus algicola]MCA0988345.1 GNAT family N-acetyltransferase [Alkalihalobacillus algicola]
MEIRRFVERDIHAILDLFYETVHTVNKKDYSPEQLTAWASPLEREQRHLEWLRTLRSHFTLVAEENNQVIGFIDLTAEGLLDRLYVHKDLQRQGVASALLDGILQHAKQLELSEIKTEASITAKPFFKKHGFREIKKQQIEKNGVILTNFLMYLEINGVTSPSI